METTITKILAKTEMIRSLAEGRRHIIAKAIKLNGFIVTNPLATIEFHEGDVLELGKRKVELASEHLKES